jgi:N6-adenosine-specific RNA methylase IME4
VTDWPFGELRPLSFDLIMIDPPWLHKMRSDKGYTSKSAAGQYRTMPVDEIAALPVADLGRGDAILWTWATHAMIDQQIEVTRRWGFKFSTTGVWVKRTKTGKLAFGTGQRLRCASELFIISTLGRPETIKSVRTVLDGPVREHSRKPDEAYRVAESLYPAAINRADIFSREARPGWTQWGDEVGKFTFLEAAE